MAIYTALDYSRLLRDLGTNSTVLPDPDAEELLVEAAEVYTGVLSHKAYSRILGIQGFASSASKLSSYKANSSTENISDVFDHLMKLLAFWQAVLDKAIVDEAAVSASTRDASLRIKVVSAW